MCGFEEEGHYMCEMCLKEFDSLEAQSHLSIIDGDIICDECLAEAEEAQADEQS